MRVLGGGSGGATLHLHLSCLSSLPKNDSSIHSSPARPDFNFAINQQNKQTSGREGGKRAREWGWRGAGRGE